MELHYPKDFTFSLKMYVDVNLELTQDTRGNMGPSSGVGIVDEVGVLKVDG